MEDKTFTEKVFFQHIAMYKEKRKGLLTFEIVLPFVLQTLENLLKRMAELRQILEGSLPQKGIFS